jgi:hypothetical protein
MGEEFGTEERWRLHRSTAGFVTEGVKDGSETIVFATCLTPEQLIR